jgi:crossover junction endodeoxyribonuclease RuvC
MTPTRIVGLDLSLTATGYSVIDLPGTYFNTGVLEPGKLTGLARIDLILNYVVGFAKTGSLFVIEDFSFGSKGQAVFQIAGLGFIVRHALWKLGIQTIFVAPTTLKKFVTGAGNSDKSVMLKEIFKRWGADINDDNAGDAYGLARIGMAHAGIDTELTAFQMEALAKVKKTESL